MKRVLIVGVDEMLVETRARILEARYETAIVKPDQTLECLRGRVFDLLLVCCSTPHAQGTTLIRAAHSEFPHLCIVRLLSMDSPPVTRPIAHKLITVDYRPEIWVKAVDELLAPDALASFG
jgi:CheY-like chemotaxis protein